MFRLRGLSGRACSHKAVLAVRAAAQARAMPSPTSTKAARSAPSTAAVPAAKRAKKDIPVLVAPVLTEDGLPVLYQVNSVLLLTRCDQHCAAGVHAMSAGECAHQDCSTCYFAEQIPRLEHHQQIKQLTSVLLTHCARLAVS